MTIINTFLNLFKAKVIPPPHQCNFKCIGYCDHYHQVCEIEKSIANPSWHHYPSKETLDNWKGTGYIWASVYQSAWQCDCGKKLTYFFLANPCVDYRGQKHKGITVKEYDEMITYNPIALKSSKGINPNELDDDELMAVFCGKLL